MSRIFSEGRTLRSHLRCVFTRPPPLHLGSLGSPETGTCRAQLPFSHSESLNASAKAHSLN